jgi:hypothetical protein
MPVRRRPKAVVTAVTPLGQRRIVSRSLIASRSFIE